MLSESRMKPVYSHICAMDQNHTIGKNNQLPWDISADLKFFKEKTLKKIVLMGRKTFESLPRRPLPHRLNIVISRNTHYTVPEKVLLCHSLKSAYTLCEKMKDSSYGNEVFIIGGEQIYRQSFAQITFIYLTLIHQKYEGDSFYPQIPEDQFQLIHKESHSGHPPFSFLTYRRIPSPASNST